MKLTAAFKDAVRVWKSVKATDEKLGQDVENEIKSEYPLEYAALQTDGDKILEEKADEEVVVQPKEEMEEACDKAMDEVVSNAIVLARHNVSTIITKANDEFKMDEVADEQVDDKVDAVVDETKEEAVDDATDLREELSGDEDEKKALEPQIVDNEEAIASIRAIHSSYNKNTSVTDLPNKKFYVTATDDAPTHVEIDQPIEEKAEETEMPKEIQSDEEEVKLLTEPEAEEAIAAFKKAGINYTTKKVSKTKFIVKADELEVKEEPVKAEEQEDDVKVMSEDEMKEAVASAGKLGKKLVVTQISKTKFAVASDMDEDQVDPIEEAKEDVVEAPVEEEKEIILSAEELHDELEQASEEEMLTEPEAEEAVAKLKAEGKKHTILKASRTHYIVRAMDDGKEDTTVIDELKEDDADAPLTEEVVSEELPVVEPKEETVESDEEEVKILSEDEMKETVAKLEKEGTKHKVIKASKNKFIVTSDEDMMEEDDEQEACNEELQPVEANAHYDMNGVYTVLCYDDTENPEYFVIANRKPIATISLSSLAKDSTSTKEIRAYFVSPQYTKNLVDLIDQNGLVKTLKKVNATFFVNPAVTQEELQASFVDEKNKEYADKAINLVDNLRDRFNLSLAAFDKGMYSQDNALKAALFKAFDPIVANGDSIQAAVDSGCQEGMLPMFDAVMEKTLAFLDYSDDSLNEIRAHVKGTTTTFASTIEKGNLKK